MGFLSLCKKVPCAMHFQSHLRSVSSKNLYKVYLTLRKYDILCNVITAVISMKMYPQYSPKGKQINEWDVLDPACGSGGFLLYALDFKI